MPQPKTESPFISVVIPSFNEAQNAPVMAVSLQKVLDLLHPLGTWELVFVDEGSNDGTLEALRTTAPGLHGVTKYTAKSVPFCAN